MIDSILEAIKQSGREFDQLADTVPFATEKIIATSLGLETPLLQVLGLMIEKLRSKSKTVDSLSKPQILLLT